MYKTFTVIFIALATLGCTTGPIPEGTGAANDVSLDYLGRADTRIFGDCNIVVSLINSNNANIGNSLQCKDPRNKTAVDSEYCKRQAQTGYMIFYPTGILTLPLFPIFLLSNYISEERAQSQANENYTRCMEARGHIMNGYGTYTFENGNIYQGYWKDGAFNGQGIFRWKNGGSYDGEWKDGEKSGNGFDVYTDGVTYKGAFENGVRNGYGVQTWPDGDHFEGTFRDNRPNGHGVFTTAHGIRYEGNWSNGCFKDGDRWAVVNQDKAYCSGSTWR